MQVIVYPQEVGTAYREVEVAPGYEVQDGFGSIPTTSVIAALIDRVGTPGTTDEDRYHDLLRYIIENQCRILGRLEKLS